MATLRHLDDVSWARVQTSVDGLSVGDAFGERFFVHPQQFASLVSQRALPAAPWRYTDDTEMTLAVVETLRQHGHVDRDALAMAFARRYLRNPGRGYGGTAREILQAVALGRPWREATAEPFGGEGSMGNGSAMRVAPVGALLGPDYPRVVSEARATAEVTHFHPDGQAGAVAIAVAAAWATAWRPTSGAPQALFDCVLEWTPTGETHRGLRAAKKLSLGATPQEAASVLGSGQHVICSDTVPFSVWCIARHLGQYEEAMWCTVAGGGDRDTTCAIVGGVVALTDPTGIPPAWLEAREPLETP